LVALVGAAAVVFGFDPESEVVQAGLVIAQALLVYLVPNAE
jgi:hypothetical protein